MNNQSDYPFVSNRAKLIFAKTVRVPHTDVIFYTDIYENPKTGLRHLSICQNLKSKDGGIERIRINVTPEQARDLVGALQEAVDFFDNNGDCREDEKFTSEAV